MSDKPAAKKIFDLSLLKRVFRFAAPYKNKFYTSLILAVVLALMSPLRPALIQYTINDAVAGHSKFNFWGSIQGAIITITIIQIGLLLIESACRFFFTFLTASLGQSVVKDMRVTAYRKILGLNLAQFDKTPIGTLTTRTINDIESVNDIFSDGLIPIIADLLSIIAVLAYMFSTDATLTLISLAPFPILIVATYFFKETVNKSFIQVRNAVASLNAFVQEHITGMAVVQAFAAEKREAGHFKTINQQHRNANIRSIFAYSVFFPVVELILALSTGLLVWWAAQHGAGHATPGIITSFILCLNLLFRPLRVIADKFNVLQMGMIAGERVFKMMDNADTTPEGGSYAPAHIKGDVQFSNVQFAYTEGQPVLKNISFSIRAGETLALVGHTGSGKTSIISLLNRLYHIQSGTITIDGSVQDNITLRNEAISPQAVVEAAKLIGIHDFIMRLPGGYQYNVMERGATLSLGQRQLLSFVRTLLYNPAILILDEATSSVDTESEQLIQNAIDKLIADRTSIVIAHRLSTIRKADSIMVLDKGEIKEMGSHEALMAQQGMYAQLYAMQFEAKEG
jgi:ATP-binding cassette, subfamily B, multidrug efflux pump